MLLKFFICVLVFEVWSNEEIVVEILEFKEEIFDFVFEIVKIMIFDVYFMINGCNKIRFVYFFFLFLNCYLYLEERKGLLILLNRDLVDLFVKLG